MLLVSKKERLEMAKRAKLTGEKVKHLIADIDGEAKRLVDERLKSGKKMEIQLHPFRPDRFKDTNNTFTYAKDPETGVYFGIVSKVFDDGNIMWRKIHMLEHETLNLNNFEDAKVWAVMRMHPAVKDSPYAKAEPKYVVFDPEKVAEEELRFADLADIASERSKTLTGRALVHFARFLGIDVEQSSPTMIISSVRKYALQNPEVFNEKWDDNERALKELLESAMTLGLVDVDSKGYVYDGFPMGMSEHNAIQTLKDHGDILSKLSRAVNDSDDISKKAIDEVKSKSDENKKTNKQKSNNKEEEDF